MTDSKITELTALTTPQKTDLLIIEDDPSGTPNTKSITLENMLKVINDLTSEASPVTGSDYAIIYSASASAPRKVLLDNLGLGAYGDIFGQDGMMLNGKLSVTVASNNLTVAIKTLAGSDPSSSDPVYVRVGNTIRSITAALSRTLNAGTNWMNLGGSELATKEVDLFPYLVWDSNSSAVGLTFARRPDARLISDFSSTTTNEKHCAGYSDFTSTDDCVNIGRFAATLSGGAGYTWTVPTFTSKNLINRPIFTTRWLDFVPQWSGSSSMTVTSVSTSHAKYQVTMDNCELDIVVSAFTIGGTPSPLIYMTLPFSSALSTFPLISGGVPQTDAAGTDMGYIRNDNTVTRAAWVKRTGSNWTSGSGTFLAARGSYTI